MRKTFQIAFLIFAGLFLAAGALGAKSTSIHVEPPNWWAGMKSPELQLMVYAENIGHTRAAIDYPGVQLKESIAVDNPNYLFLNLRLSPEVHAGSFDIAFFQGDKLMHKLNYELFEREPGSADRKGFDNSDVVYLIMPDRFANGDPTNDNISGFKEKADRSNPDGRHGGDLAGIGNHLDYFESLGVSALWLNPVLENNMPAYSYHGYAITDFYNIDARLGSNADFRLLTQKLKARGIKMIMDKVFNHFGTAHWWLDDLPMQNWIHQWPEFTRSNYRGGTITDPYASDYDKKLMLKGWFDTNMADFNQQNPYVATYLIQNSIWWIEYAGLSGIRMDTYPYSYKQFMADWMKRINLEYPNFSVVGEAWLGSPSQVAYWQHNQRNHDGYESHLDYIFDFPLKDALNQAFTEGNGWNTGVARIYETLSHDFVYENPHNSVVFIDNHDADRIYTRLGEDIRKLKMALAFLMTTRGVPQLYYGTELLMTGWEHDGHGHIREDFPGGWPGDEINAFNRSGRTGDQNDIMDFITMLNHWRKNKEVIHHGKLTHYIPEDGMYVYFRHNDEESIMVILNNTEDHKNLITRRFAENLAGYSSGTDVLHRSYFNKLSEIGMPPMSARIIQLSK